MSHDSILTHRRYMIDRGANPNFVYSRDLTGSRKEVVTPMHIAVDLSHYDVVDMLLDRNTSCNIRDHSSETPLLVAVQKADWVINTSLMTPFIIVLQRTTSSDQSK